MELGELVRNIVDLGFPIVVCLWFMLRFEKLLKANTEAFIELKSAIELKKIK